MKLKHFTEESLDDLYRITNGYSLFDRIPLKEEDDDGETSEPAWEGYDVLYDAIGKDIESGLKYPDDIVYGGDAETEEETD